MADRRRKLPHGQCRTVPANRRIGLRQFGVGVSNSVQK
jgi:hypothetical protein